jgi:hypothetical protein
MEGLKHFLWYAFTSLAKMVATIAIVLLVYLVVLLYLGRLATDLTGLQQELNRGETETSEPRDSNAEGRGGPKGYIECSGTYC